MHQVVLTISDLQGSLLKRSPAYEGRKTAKSIDATKPGYLLPQVAAGEVLCDEVDGHCLGIVPPVIEAHDVAMLECLENTDFCSNRSGLC